VVRSTPNAEEIVVTRQQVVKLARAKWCQERGSVPETRYRKNAPTREENERARADLKAHRAIKPPRCAPEYTDWWKRERALMAVALAYPYEVGYRYCSPMLGMQVCSIHGTGFSWEEAARAAKLIS
jgi:hypothetical protein